MLFTRSIRHTQKSCDPIGSAYGLLTPPSEDCKVLAGQGKRHAFVPGHPVVLPIGDASTRGAADLTIDAPPGLWTSVRAENRGQQTIDSHCVVGIDLPDATEVPTYVPWLAEAFTPKPSPAAPDLAGYRITATSEECAPVASIDAPEAFECDANAEQSIVDRGHVHVCSGCVASCDDLEAG